MTIAASTAELDTGATGGPQAEADRYHILDALRGFALLGIFLANIRFFSGWEFAGPDLRAELAGGALSVYEQIQTIFVDGKFYTLFSLLFGIGFSLQLSRLKSAGPGAVKLYLRRLSILLAIGLVHLFGFWSGDILTPYALIGFALLLVRDWPDKAILRLAAFFFVMPFVGHIAFWALNVSPDLGFYALGFGVASPAVAAFQGDLLGVLQSDRWATFFAFNLTGGFIRFGYLFESWRFFKLAFVMLIGLWVGRRIIAGTFFDNFALLKRVAIGGFAIGLPVGFIYAQVGPVSAFAGPPDMEGLGVLTVYMFSVFPMGFAYGAAFALAWRSRQNVLRRLAAPGRMALTNYLLQTALGIAIFYGVGFGLAGKTSPAGFVAIALIIFAGQVVFSTMWLKRFKYGPMEWLWRCCTYGRALAIARS